MTLIKGRIRSHICIAKWLDSVRVDRWSISCELFGWDRWGKIVTYSCSCVSRQWHCWLAAALVISTQPWQRVCHGPDLVTTWPFPAGITEGWFHSEPQVFRYRQTLQICKWISLSLCYLCCMIMDMDTLHLITDYFKLRKENKLLH